MLEPKSRLFHAIVVMGLGVTGCGTEPAPIVDASADATTQKDSSSSDSASNDTGSPFSDGATDAPNNADAPVSCPSECGGPCPCMWCPDAGPDAFPCYV